MRLAAAGEHRQFSSYLFAAYVFQCTAFLTLAANLIGWPAGPGPFPHALGLTIFLSAAIFGLLPSFWLNVWSYLKQRPD